MADELIDKITGALISTNVYSEQVLSLISKLSCFYGGNERAFLILAV